MSSDVLGHGKVAVVTGAGSGIGAALAHQISATGSSVVVADIDAAVGEAVAAAILAAGGDATAIVVDVADAVSVQALADATIAAYGRVDVLCNNAGVSTFNLMRDQTLEDWKWVFSVNLWGVVHGVHAFVPLMRAQGTRGHIVNTASIAGLMSGIAFIAPYAATKVGVVSISESMVKEFAIDGTDIGVSVLCPSSVDTKVLESERNRPSTLGHEQRTDMAESVRLMIKDSFTSDTGQTPEQVAGTVIDAIRRDRFWIITHPFDRATIHERAEDILSNFPDA
jgi:NAD(P)-dependent dehydrogenase (short-subunit alcohol dehydrogenase family)